MKYIFSLFFLLISSFLFSQALNAGDTVLFSTTGDTVLTKGTVVKTSNGMVNTFFAIYKRSPKADSVLDVARMRFTNPKAMSLSELPLDTIKKYHLYNKGVKVNFDSVPGSSFTAMELNKESKGPNAQQPDMEIFASTFFFQVIFAKKTLISDEKFSTVYMAKENDGVNRSDIVMISSYKMINAPKYFVMLGVKRTKIDPDGTINTDVKLKRFLVSSS